MCEIIPMFSNLSLVRSLFCRALKVNMENFGARVGTQTSWKKGKTGLTRTDSQAEASVLIVHVVSDQCQESIPVTGCTFWISFKRGCKTGNLIFYSHLLRCLPLSNALSHGEGIANLISSEENSY